MEVVMGIVVAAYVIRISKFSSRRQTFGVKSQAEDGD
jgi:hypothetical protein